MKNNLFSLKQLVIASLCVLGGLFSNELNAQNNIWSLAPNYLASGFSPASFPFGSNPGFDYAGEVAVNTRNAMQDADGNLLFFMVDDKVFDKDGYFIDNVYFNNVAVKGTSEIAFIPDPANCQKYYIVAAGREIYGENFKNKIPYLAVLDLSLPNIYHSGRYGALVTSNTGTAVNIGAMTPGYIQNPTKQGYVFVAASKLRSDNSRFVFISNGYGIYRYKVKNPWKQGMKS